MEEKVKLQSVPTKGQILENASTELKNVQSDVGKLMQGVLPYKLEPRTIVPISVLRKNGYRFARIKLNRSLDLKHVKKMVKSIKSCGGITNPFLVIPALECLHTGLELEDEGKNITQDTPDIDFVLAVLDGQHRLEALKLLNEKMKKEGNPEYEGYCFLPLLKHYDVVTLLREANITTSPWDGMDWLSQLLVTAKKQGIPTEKLEWVKEQSCKGSDSAAWGWIYEGKIKSKAECIKASNDPKKLEKLADTTSFSDDKKLYEAASRSFTLSAAKVLGWKVLPEWVYAQLDKLVKKDMVRSEAISYLVSFLENISSSTAQEISNIKKSSTQSKDNQILAKLDELFADFAKKDA